MIDYTALSIQGRLNKAEKLRLTYKTLIKALQTLKPNSNLALKLKFTMHFSTTLN